MRRINTIGVIVFSILLLFTQCKKENDLSDSQDKKKSEPKENNDIHKPKFLNDDGLWVKCLTESSAKIEVVIVINKEFPITELGFYYSKKTNIFKKKMKSKPKPNKDGYTFELNNLEPNTTYYLKPYAINEKGESIGKMDSLKTYNGAFHKKIGDKHAGGIIISFDCTGHHGIVLSEEYFYGQYSWTNAEYYARNSKEKGYDDWTLASIGDYKNMYKNLYLKGKGDFNDGNSFYDRYWHSNKYSDPDNPHFLWDFSYGFSFNKNDYIKVEIKYKLLMKAVRKF